MTHTPKNAAPIREPEGPPLAQRKHISAAATLDAGRIRLHLCGREWVLHRPADLETLWESITDEAFSADERLPYWVELWPASLALAEWLTANSERIKGRVCLDLGCGLGFTALVGSMAGAKVIAMDYEPEALTFSRKNALANAVPNPLWTVMDWRRPAVAPKRCDIIWGGDIMYENRFVAPVFDFLDYALAEEGLVWLAEPGRNAYELFKSTVLRRGWKSRRVASNSVEALHTQSSPVSVKLWELSRN